MHGRLVRSFFGHRQGGAVTKNRRMRGIAAAQVQRAGRAEMRAGIGAGDGGDDLAQTAAVKGAKAHEFNRCDVRFMMAWHRNQPIADRHHARS